MPRITIEQKLQLRNWYDSQEKRPSQIDAILWFKAKYGETLPQYQISRILHSKALQAVDLNSPGIYRTRVDTAQWPVLEQILKRWQIGMEVRGMHTTREVLMEKARAIWMQYPDARNHQSATGIPVFGPRWCTLFQKRFSIRNRPPNGARSATKAVTGFPETSISGLQQLVSETPVGNRYNMSQTGLFWRRSTNKPGRKLDQTRISVAITTNDTGDDSPDLWVVGKAACPHALKQFNWQAQKVIWRHNDSAWVTTPIMNEWLKAFYSHIQATKPGQKVLLLLDNIKPYIAALEETPPPHNITIELFPSNTTSKYQPNAMGITGILKTYYRRSFLVWMCKQRLDATSKDPIAQMNLRLAMGWLSVHWFVTIKPETIHKAWVQSTLLDSNSENVRPAQDAPNDLNALYIRANAGLKDRMARSAFFNPEGEDKAPEEPTTEMEVLEQVLRDWTLASDYRDADEVAEESAQAEISHISLQEGLLNLTKLIGLVESNESFTSSELQNLHRLRQSVIKAIQASGTQNTIDRAFQTTG